MSSSSQKENPFQLERRGASSETGTERRRRQGRRAGGWGLAVETLRVGGPDFFREAGGEVVCWEVGGLRVWSHC